VLELGCATRYGCDTVCESWGKCRLRGLNLKIALQASVQNFEVHGLQGTFSGENIEERD
jgi:hypothetical protein